MYFLPGNFRIEVKMNRRNVLGNQTEESKSMWIVLTGIMVSVLQFAIYYFVSGGWLGLLLAGLCMLLGGVLVHFITGELGELFAYLLIPCVFFGGMGLLLPHTSESVFPENSTALIGCVLAWLIPVVYSCLYTWAEGNTALSQFSGFYKKAAIFFYMAYLGLLIYWFAVYKRIPVSEIKMQPIPFATFAAYVDGIINDAVPIGRLVEFVAERILLFLPYGFFIAMVGRRLHSLLRLLLVVALPLLVELLQLLFALHSCDADDVVFSFLGGLIGMLGFVIFNSLFQRTTGKNFDGSEIERDYYGRKI